jgi:hypothetical protein
MQPKGKLDSVIGEDDAKVVSGAPMPQDEYCRAIESYLCRKNEGHLIRIVGPAFENVCAWGDQGVPLKVVYRGIDRYLERHNARNGRRRPVRIEFCEADVLDVFDEWRRAVGVSMARETSASDGADEEEAGRHRGSLKSHLERAIARVGALRGAGQPLDASLAAAEEELRALTDAGALRGEARREALERLRDLDARLLAAARAQCDDDTLSRLRAEAEQELAPFRSRMAASAYQQSLEACVARLVRERTRLPLLIFD